MIRNNRNYINKVITHKVAQNNDYIDNSFNFESSNSGSNTDNWGNEGSNFDNSYNHNSNTKNNADIISEDWENNMGRNSHKSNNRNNGDSSDTFNWDDDSVGNSNSHNSNNRNNRDSSDTFNWDNDNYNNAHNSNNRGRNGRNNNRDDDDYGFNSNDWDNHNSWDNDYNRKKPKEIVGMTLLRKFEDLLNFFTSPDKVQRLLNKNRFMWRDTLIKREKAFINSLNHISDPQTRFKIKETLIKHSRSLLETAEYDLKLQNKNNSPIDNLKDFFSNTNHNLSGVKNFWAETIDMQSDILHHLETKNINTNVGSDEQIKKAIKLDAKLNTEIFSINDNYCDLLLIQITRSFDKAKAKESIKEKYKEIKQLQSHSRKHLKIYANHNGENIYEFKKDLKMRQDILKKVDPNSRFSINNKKDKHEMQPSM